MVERSTRTWPLALSLICSSAFAGANVFIGLSMGHHWLSLESQGFTSGFWSQFTSFTLTIMPLFVLTLMGLLLALRDHWDDHRQRTLWLGSLGCFVGVSLITLLFHVPLNIQMRAPDFTDLEANRIRALWLIGHLPRTLLLCGIPLLAWKAVTAAGLSPQSSDANQSTAHPE